MADAGYAPLTWPARRTTFLAGAGEAVLDSRPHGEDREE
jgi:hypothetical protein